MNLVRWKRFTWDLLKSPAPAASALHSFVIRPAAREDERSLREVVDAAISLDLGFGDMSKHLRHLLESQAEAACALTPIPALVVKHGQRVIAASLLSTEVDAENHLLSGPCVLAEYRNRGIGSALLLESLRTLQDAGLSIVHGICHASSPAEKFLYRKYGSTSDAFQFELAAVAQP